MIKTFKRTKWLIKFKFLNKVIFQEIRAICKQQKSHLAQYLIKIKQGIISYITLREITHFNIKMITVS